MSPSAPIGSPTTRRALAEAIGTFFLVFIGHGAVMVNAYAGGAVSHVGVGLSFAFVVIAMVYALGHLSGAHINPAVTIDGTAASGWCAGTDTGRAAAGLAA